MNPLKWKVKVVLTFFLVFLSLFLIIFSVCSFFVEFHHGLLGSSYTLLQLVFLWFAWLQLQRLAQSEYVLVIK